jgi:hypothetical protein
MNAQEAERVNFDQSKALRAPGEASALADPLGRRGRAASPASAGLASIATPRRVAQHVRCAFAAPSHGAASTRKTLPFAVSLRPFAPRLHSSSAARASTPFKEYKITPGDWRNREKCDAYRIAVGDMADRTNAERAPWTLIEARPEPPGSKTLHTLCDSARDPSSHARAY